MPTYDYRCAENGRTVEVRHAMNVRLRTWGELCAQAGLDPADVPPEAPVEKLLGTGGVVRSENLGSGTQPMCERNAGPCCGGGGCPMM